MPDAHSTLTRLCGKANPGDFSFSLSRDEVVANLISLGAAPNSEKAIELLEAEEPKLMDTIFSDGWALHYNVYTNRYSFDRLLPPELLARVAELHSKSIERNLTDALSQLSPRQFEFFLGSLLSHLPRYISVRVSRATRDGGVDFTALYGEPDSPYVHVYGQAKHWKSPVSAPEVQKLVGVLAYKAKSGFPVRGMLVALAGFTDPADRLIRDAPFPMERVDLADLTALMIKNGIGTKRFSVEGVVTDQNFWEELHGL